MRAVLELVLASLRAHSARSTLTALSTLAATLLVLSVVSGYDALVASYDQFADRALGRYELSVDAISTGPERRVDAEVAEALRADPDVLAADAMWARKVTAQPLAGVMERAPEILLLGTDAAEPPFEMRRGRWVGGGPADSLRVALSAEIAERLGADLGDELTLGRGEGARTLTVVGIVENPPVPLTGRYTGSIDLPSPSIAGAYVTLADAAAVHRLPPVATFLGVDLADGVDVHRFRFRWGTKLSRFERPARFQEDFDLEEELNQAGVADNMRLQSYAVTAVAMLLAFLVTFNTLNMGVTERIRQLALLRAVAFTRGQVALLVLGEALVLATLGFLPGLLLGLGVAAAADQGVGPLFRAGASIGPVSLLMAAVAAYGAALIAALYPAWRATRLRPLDAIAPQMARTASPRRGILGFALAGTAALAVHVGLGIVFPPGADGAVVAAMLASYVALALGCVLITPVLVVLVEHLAAPLLASLLGLDRQLLEQQLSGHLWRSVGSALTLSVGLGLFIAVQVWGRTMLETYVPGSWAPDAILALGGDGTSLERARRVAELPGVDPDRCLPLVLEQPRLLEDLTGSAERVTVTRQDNVLIVGLDPERAFAGERPLLRCDWVRGSAEGAVASLAAERGCVVPEHFLRESGLDLGDRFEVVPPESPKTPVSYTIAGSVELDGWHWQTKNTGMRVRTHRSAALVFARFDNVARDFELDRVSHVWFSYAEADTDAASIAAQARTLFGEAAGAEPASADAEPVEAVALTPVEDIRTEVRTTAARWLWTMSVFPLIAVGIASLGLLNVIVASVRARRWDFGVLRSIGFTRGTLVRLVVAEGFLFGLVACLTSFLFGLFGGWSGTIAANDFSFFGGLEPVLVVPVAMILLGWGVLLAFAVVAALWPAVAVGRMQPLTLLQEGRASF
ncbi:MAG: FtsX-like permease family protein [Planctomycetota bacterium]